MKENSKKGPKGQRKNEKEGFWRKGLWERKGETSEIAWKCFGGISQTKTKTNKNKTKIPPPQKKQQVIDEEQQQQKQQ